MPNNNKATAIEPFYKRIVIFVLAVLCILTVIAMYLNFTIEKSDKNSLQETSDHDLELDNIGENELTNLKEKNDDLEGANQSSSQLNQKISKYLLLYDGWEYGQSKGWHGVGIDTWWRLKSLEPVLTMSGPQFRHSFGSDHDLAYWIIEVNQDNMELYYEQAKKALLLLGFIEDQTRQLSNPFGGIEEGDRLALYIYDGKVYSLTYYYSDMQIFDANAVALRELGMLDEFEEVEEKQRNSLIAATQKTNGTVDEYFDKQEYSYPLSNIHIRSITDISTDEDHANHIERFDASINPFSDICMGHCYSVSFTVNNQTGEIKTVLKIFTEFLLHESTDISCAQFIDNEVTDSIDRRILIDHYCNGQFR